MKICTTRGRNISVGVDLSTSFVTRLERILLVSRVLGSCGDEIGAGGAENIEKGIKGDGNIVDGDGESAVSFVVPSNIFDIKIN